LPPTLWNMSVWCYIIITKHSINSRLNSSLNQPSPNSATCQKEICYFGIKVNSLPSHMKNLSRNTKQFRSTLKSFLCTNSFCSLNTYFNIEMKVHNLLS
jgi:hypothetical protein